jgi:hypothetical protein
VRLRDHWAQTAPLWEHGEPMVTWHVLPEGRLDPLAAALAPLVDRPWLTRVPPAGLHLTVRNVGPAGSLAAGARERLVAEAGERLAELVPVEALVGPARVVEEGVTADVLPCEPLAAVYTALPGVPAEPFWPHVTFAYAHAEGDMEPLAVELFAPLRIDAVSLILLRRERRLYCWDVLESVPLGGSG